MFAGLTRYKLMLLPPPCGWGQPLTSSALEGFGKGNFPDSCADDVRGREGSLCAFPGRIGSVVPTAIKACFCQ